MGTRPARTGASAASVHHPRPLAIRLTVIFLIIAATANLAGAIVSALLLWQPAENQLLFGSGVSDWFWALSAVLFLALALVYAYVTRAVLKRDAGAGLAVSILGLLGVGYSLLSITHAYGWGVLAISLGMLASNQAATAQGYYTGHALSMRDD